jgi:nitroreductase
MTQRALAFFEEMNQRRSIRMFSPDTVPIELIELAVQTASTAPSGAHKQPWTFIATQNSEIKRAIREAAEEEERTNYLENRMNADWQQAIAPLGTDYHKEFLEIAPWLVVLFEQRYEITQDGSQRKNYYVKESVGIAAGLFIASLHRMGLSTLTHTPSPMKFLNQILERPVNERPFCVFPIGYPLDDVKVPDIQRKELDEILHIL